MGANAWGRAPSRVPRTAGCWSAGTKRYASWVARFFACAWHGGVCSLGTDSYRAPVTALAADRAPPGAGHRRVCPALMGTQSGPWAPMRAPGANRCAGWAVSTLACTWRRWVRSLGAGQLPVSGDRASVCTRRQWVRRLGGPHLRVHQAPPGAQAGRAAPSRAPSTDGCASLRTGPHLRVHQAPLGAGAHTWLTPIREWRTSRVPGRRTPGIGPARSPGHQQSCRPCQRA